MVQMQSFSRLAMVFFTAPLGIVGASLALNLAGKPFGFVALLGLIALAGMDMRNTVILVDQIETDVRERGLRRRRASLLQPAQLPADVSDPRGETLSNDRRVQGLEPKPRTRGRDDNSDQLRSDPDRAAD